MCPRRRSPHEPRPHRPRRRRCRDAAETVRSPAQRCAPCRVAAACSARRRRPGRWRSVCQECWWPACPRQCSAQRSTRPTTATPPHPCWLCRRANRGQRVQRPRGAVTRRAGRAGRLPRHHSALAGTAHRPIVDRRHPRRSHLGRLTRLIPAPDNRRWPRHHVCRVPRRVGAALHRNLDRAVLHARTPAAANNRSKIDLQRLQRHSRSPGRCRMT